MSCLFWLRPACGLDLLRKSACAEIANARAPLNGRFWLRPACGLDLLRKSACAETGSANTITIRHLA
jgi:hypothetical protein